MGDTEKGVGSHAQSSVVRTEEEALRLVDEAIAGYVGVRAGAMCKLSTSSLCSVAPARGRRQSH